MNTLSLAPDRAPSASILAQASDVAHRRDRAAACALDFRVYGDTVPASLPSFIDPFDPDGTPRRLEPVSHAERCVCSPPCSFDYDPRPYAEAEPTDTAMYEGTAIGALYGLPGCPPLSPSVLDGWNVKESR